MINCCVWYIFWSTFPAYLRKLLNGMQHSESGQYLSLASFWTLPPPERKVHFWLAKEKKTYVFLHRRLSICIVKSACNRNSNVIKYFIETHASKRDFTPSSVSSRRITCSVSSRSSAKSLHLVKFWTGRCNATVIEALEVKSTETYKIQNNVISSSNQNI